MGVFKVLMTNLLKGPATEAFPFGPAPTPPRYRGRVAFDPECCTGCRLCEHVCPGGAIHIDETADGLDVTIWHNTCAFCGLCAHYCLSKAIHLTADWHLAHPQSEKYELVERAHVPMVPCAGCGKPMLRASEEVMRLAYRGRTAEIDRLRSLCPDCRRTESVKGGHHVQSYP